MKRTCSMCGRPQEPEEFLGSACGRCEKITADAEVELLIVSSPSVH